jgi:hypothetical protein
MGKSTSRFQPDHGGHHTPVAVNPGMVVSHQSHSLDATRGGDGGKYSGRDGKPKHTGPVAVAAGMHRVTGTNEGAPKIETLSSIPDASNPLAADPTRPGKSFVGKAVLPVPGQRSRTGDALGGSEPGENHGRAQASAVKDHAMRVELGQRVIGEALDCAEPDHPSKLGRA